MTVRDDGSVMTVSWLPTYTSQLLVGFTSDWKDVGMAAILDVAAAEELAAAIELFHAKSIPAPNGTHVCVHPANRGEPFREGLEISIEGENYEQFSVFIEGFDTTYVSDLIRKQVGKPGG